MVEDHWLSSIIWLFFLIYLLGASATYTLPVPTLGRFSVCLFLSVSAYLSGICYIPPPLDCTITLGFLFIVIPFLFYCLSVETLSTATTLFVCCLSVCYLLSIYKFSVCLVSLLSLFLLCLLTGCWLLSVYILPDVCMLSTSSLCYLFFWHLLFFQTLPTVCLLYAVCCLHSISCLSPACLSAVWILSSVSSCLSVWYVSSVCLLSIFLSAVSLSVLCLPTICCMFVYYLVYVCLLSTFSVCLLLSTICCMLSAVCQFCIVCTIDYLSLFYLLSVCRVFVVYLLSAYILRTVCLTAISAACFLSASKCLLFAACLQ